jgi:spoIIIJ-associated protein
MEKNLLKIKEIVEQLLGVMDFSGEVAIDDRDENFLRVNIQSAEAAYLIGRSGENLKALQHITRAIVNKELGEASVHFTIDINDYQNSRLELLKEMARSLAKEVIEQREPRWLAPMNAYERRIIHMALSDLREIKTESEGEGSDRKIVIRPVGLR